MAEIVRAVEHWRLDQRFSDHDLASDDVESTNVARQLPDNGMTPTEVDAADGTPADSCPLVRAIETILAPLKPQARRTR